MVSRLGFDGSRLGFTLPTALAACLALLAAWLLGLEHPQWSAMTVWAASQPVRGQLLEKSFFRFAGTVSGTIVGILLVVASDNQPVVLVLGLAAWVGLCAGIGNLQRSFVSYGTMLAGYSAAMVALLDTAHPDQVYALGADRLLTVLVGVVTALVVGWLYTRKDAGEEVLGSVRHLSARILRDMASHLRGEQGGGREELKVILSEMAAIEESLDPHGAGSLRSRQMVRGIRRLLLAQVSALLWLRTAPAAPEEEGLGSALIQAADALDASAPAEAVTAPLERAVSLSAAHPALQGVLMRMEAALREHLGTSAGAARRQRQPEPVILHRDWIGARHALIRAVSAILFVGMLWLLTGWASGPYMLLGTAIMLSLFLTFDNPALTMRFIFMGQVLGAAGALICRWLVWPLATGEAGLVLLTMPFILLGAFVLSHRRTMAGGMDFNMVMLLLLQPVYPLAGSFGHSLTMVAAVLTGPTVAFIAYRLIYPVDIRRRMDMLVTMMVHELQDMAAASGKPEKQHLWRVRLYHRLLRLVRWTEKTGEEKISAADGSLAVLELGSAIRCMQALLREPDVAPATARSLDAALKRMRRLGERPESARRALDLAALRLSRQARAEADQLRSAAAGLSANLGFFLRAAGEGR